jgi:kynurenine 3-monooxygenase
MNIPKHQKLVVVGAGPVGSLAALYAATRGDDVEIYELRGGERRFSCHGFNPPVSLLLTLSIFCFFLIGYLFRDQNLCCVLLSAWAIPLCQAFAPERENGEFPQVSTILDLIGPDWNRIKLNTCLLQIFGKPPPLP